MRYRLGMDGIRWARTADVTPKTPRDVLKLGDIVYVLPSGEGRGAARADPRRAGRLRRARPARRLHRRALGRLRLRRLEVQPRDAGAPPAGLVVQALHLLRRARGRAHARDGHPRCAGRLRGAGRGRSASARTPAPMPRSRAPSPSRRTGGRATTRAASTARRACAMRSRARATSSRSASCARSASATRATT